MTDPRPFHIGDEVKVLRPWKTEHNEQGWRVFGATPNAALIYYEPPERPGYHMSEIIATDRLVHASDGAPLGEFVPISEEAFRALGLAWDDYLEPHKTVNETLDALNALIRGE